MATITIYVPAKITIENKGTKLETFIPKGENFQVPVEAGDKVEFIADTAEKVFYYLGQATANLAVTQVDADE